MTPPASPASRYALALLYVMEAEVARLLIASWAGGGHPFAAFTLAVAASAWRSGAGPAAMALGLGAILACLPAWARPAGRSDWPDLVAYLGAGAAMLAWARRARGDDPEGRERLRMAIDSSEIGTWDFEPASGQLRWSARTRAFFGVGPVEDLDRERALALIHPEDREGVERANREALDPRGDGVFRAEYRCLAPGQPERWLVSRGRASFEGEGPARRAVRLTGTVLDFTDRRRDERAIAEHARLAEFGRDIGIALTRGATLAEMLDRCARATVRHLDAAFARVWTVDESGETLELQASAGMYTHLDGPHCRVPVGQFKIGRIARDRVPHLTNAVVGDPQVPAQDWARSEGMVSFAGYPLVVEDRLVGVIAMFARAELSAATLDRLGSVADEVAVGIERKRAVERLQRSREWLRVTLASVGDAVIATDTAGRVSFLNPVAEALTGWGQAEAIGHPLAEVFRIIGESSREEVESPAARALREGVVVGLANHTILVRKDGSEVAIDDSAAPIRDEAGAILGAVLVFRDVERRRRAERELERSEARKAAILAAALDAIVTIDHDGRVLEWNPAAARTFGREAAAVLGRSMPDLIIPPRYREAYRRGLDHYLETGQGPILGRRLDLSALRADGEVFPIEMAITRIPGDGPPTFTAHIRDITERKRSEGRLAFQAEAGAVLAGSLDYRATLAEVARLAVASLAETCAVDLALEADRVERVASAHADPSGPHPGDPAPRAIATGASVLVASAGPRDLLSVPIPAPDRVLGAITFGLTTPGWSFDEADVRLAEDIGRRAGVALNNALLFREAQDANRAKDQFLAVLSHELRTPLNPILLAATSMLDRPGDPDELRPTLEMIRQNVNLQARLIDDLLDVMRIVRGKMPLHWEVVDAHRLIHQAHQICRSEVFGKSLRLDLDLAAGEHHVNADPARLQQVFWNLIKNAVKFTPEGGTIAIRTRNVPAAGTLAGRLVVEVSDSGIGIDPEVLPRIFDPFQQGETTITRKFGGLGLGLAICRGVVEAHGGTIEVESAGPGRGTTFRVGLDALPQTAVEPEAEPGAVPRPGPPIFPSQLRILVVEDEPATLRLMARLLRGLGHEVDTANTITRGLEVLDGAPIDLVISDIGLPDGSGLDLMRKVVARRGAVPAIALTGYGMEEDIRRSREAGFTAHLTKPIDFVKLEAMIQQVAPARP